MGEEINKWQVDSIQTSFKQVSNYFLPSSNNGMSFLSYHLRQGWVERGRGPWTMYIHILVKE
jgi:hypothetical protein